MWFDLDAIHSLPQQSGVYQYFDAQECLLYIGKAKNLKKRVGSYFLQKNHTERIHQMVGQIAKIFVQVTPTEQDALILENHLIRQHKPKYNVIFKDDKSYPFLKITAHAFPRLMLFRGRNQDGHVFGPYPDAYAARTSVEILQRIFKLRTCEDSVFHHREKPCLLYQIKRCSAPCVGLSQDYHQDVEHTMQFLKGAHKQVFHNLEQRMHHHASRDEFEQAAILRDQLQALQALFKKQQMDIQKNWDVDIIQVAQEGAYLAMVCGMVRAGRHLGYQSFVHHLPEHFLDETDASLEYILSFLSQQYVHLQPKQKRFILLPYTKTQWLEWQDFMPNFHYLNHRLQIAQQWLSAAKENAHMLLERHLAQQKTADQQIYALKTHFPQLPLNPHIECFDISHTQGAHTKASCVVFQEKQLQTKQYRHFNVQPKVGGDDYEAMFLAVSTRYKHHTAQNLPDMILIDGGAGQLRAAMQALENLNLPTQALVSIVKGEKRQVGLERLICVDGEILTLGSHHAGLMLLARIRDAAHNFAVKKMQHKRAKTLKTSILDEVEGIGAVKKRRLFTYFGDIQAIQKASVDELMRVPGISLNLAKNIASSLGKTLNLLELSSKIKDS